MEPEPCPEPNAYLGPHPARRYRSPGNRSAKHSGSGSLEGWGTFTLFNGWGGGGSYSAIGQAGGRAMLGLSFPTLTEPAQK